jgi:hypothetical protein
MEALHACVDRVKCAQQQDRDALADVAQGRQHGETVDFRQHDVQHDCVEAAGERSRQAFPAVQCLFDREAVVFERARNLAGGRLVIFDNEHLRRVPTRAGGAIHFGVHQILTDRNGVAGSVAQTQSLGICGTILKAKRIGVIVRRSSRTSPTVASKLTCRQAQAWVSGRRRHARPRVRRGQADRCRSTRLAAHP